MPLMWALASAARNRTTRVISKGSSQPTGCACRVAYTGSTSSAVGDSRSGRIIAYIMSL